jgi:hydrogenase-1 operon protein HyaE
VTSPLIDQLIEQHGYPVVTADRLDDFLARETTLALFLSEDPKRYPESNDVAVILPQLATAFSGRFEPALVDRALEPLFKQRYDIAVWPCLVFLRNGRFLGKISKVRDWADYMDRIPAILDSEPKHNPGVGIPVVDASPHKAPAQEQPHA